MRGPGPWHHAACLVRMAPLVLPRANLCVALIPEKRERGEGKSHLFSL
jgi:hypothetical protein